MHPTTNTVQCDIGYWMQCTKGWLSNYSHYFPRLHWIGHWSNSVPPFFIQGGELQLPHQQDDVSRRVHRRREANPVRARLQRRHQRAQQGREALLRYHR